MGLLERAILSRSSYSNTPRAWTIPELSHTDLSTNRLRVEHSMFFKSITYLALSDEGHIDIDG